MANEPKLVPLMRGGVIGTLNITENGTYNVKQYASVEVDVAGSSEPVGEETTIDVLTWDNFLANWSTLTTGQAYFLEL